jgi:hypothetical protein
MDKTLEDKAIEARLERLPPRRRLPEWKPAIRAQQSLARVRDITETWRRKTEQTAYLLGKEFIWLKNKLSHGEFVRAVAETGHHIRTAQRLMEHARECDEVNRLLPYHPNRKRDTVSLLEPPEIEDKSQLDEKKPRHNSEPLNWSATEEMEAVFKMFENRVARRSMAEIEEARDILLEMVRDYVTMRGEEKTRMRGDDD